MKETERLDLWLQLVESCTKGEYLDAFHLRVILREGFAISDKKIPKEIRLLLAFKLIREDGGGYYLNYDWRPSPEMLFLDELKKEQKK